MSGKSIISNSYLEDIGDAIRYKKGTEETYYPSQMGDAIRSIEGIVPTGTMEIDTNGVYDVTEKAEAVVSVQLDLRPLSVSENGQYSPDDFDGYSDVTVDVEPNLESLSVTENGLYLPTAGVDGYDRVSVDVPIPVPALESLTIDTLTQSGTFLPTGDGFSQVTVEEDWDGTLYPIPDDPDKIFNAKWIPVQDGDTIIVEGYGRGRYVGTNGNNKIDANTFPTTIAVNVLPSPYFFKLRWEGTVRTLANDANVILAGYQWTADGTHASNEAYQFRGEYLHWKVIHHS